MVLVSVWRVLVLEGTDDIHAVTGLGQSAHDWVKELEVTDGRVRKQTQNSQGIAGSDQGK